jgi:Zn-dependent metalloprotease
MTGCRHPIQCLVPQSVLLRVAERGNARQREFALRTLARDQLIRTARLQNTALRGRGGPDDVDVLAQLAEPVTTTPQANRQIVDARNRSTVIGRVVRREGDAATGDDATDQAYDGFGSTFDFYRDIFGRNSIDDQGLPLQGVVHYGRDYGNAFWDGRRMVFGDGDNEVFSLLTGSLDVIGHELTHGVTEDETGLQYVGQSGALNESISDVFGSLVKQYRNNETADEANWLIGEDVWTPNIAGDALRSLKAPGTAYDDPLVGKDDQPARMDDYVFTSSDNGGVHINSGIPSHAFYLIATQIGGHAWEKAGRIWYEALLDPGTNARSDFSSFAQQTVTIASNAYGQSSSEVRAVRAGWDGVGVSVGVAIAA